MNEFVYIRFGKEYTRLAFSEIIYIESLKNYVRIVTAQNKIMIKVTLSKVEKVLPRNQFCRIHRCYIVALKAVSKFTQDVVQLQGQVFSIGEQYRKSFFERVLILDGDQSVKTEIRSHGENNRIELH